MVQRGPLEYQSEMRLMTSSVACATGSCCDRKPSDESLGYYLSPWRASLTAKREEAGSQGGGNAGVRQAEAIAVCQSAIALSGCNTFALRPYLASGA